MRLDAFSERCSDIMHLTGTYMQFQKMQKTEIGNTKGRVMTASVMTILEEFQRALEEFCLVNYDIMQIDEKAFDDDFFKFRQRIKELERRLASVLTQSFDDCDTIIGKFKLLDSFEGLLNRPIIQDELERKQIMLLELYKDDLKVVASIFQEGRILVERVDERAPIGTNMPPVSGALYWTSGLYERVREPMERLAAMSQSIQDREEFKDVQKLYNSLCKNLKEFEDQKIQEWESGVEDHTEDQLNKYLLVHKETPIAEEGFIYVNFDPILVRLLREVKYLKLLDIEVPDRAKELYKKVDIYRSQTGNLELIVDMYNNILSTLLPVEKPLLADRIAKMRSSLQPGIDTLLWNSENIDPFIKNCMLVVTDVDELVKKMKDNVKQMKKKMSNWTQPLFERKLKPQLPEDVENFHNASVLPRLEEIKVHGKDISKLMKDTSDAIKPDKKSREWLSYVDFVNGLIIEGITIGINASMVKLAEHISIAHNKQHDLQPIFDIKVTMYKREVCFEPSIKSNSSETGIYDLIHKIMRDFISLAIQMPRLDTSAGDYLVEIKDQHELFGSIQAISNNLNEIEEESSKFIQQYDDKKFLWEETLEESFANFLASGEDLREEYEKRV